MKIELKWLVFLSWSLASIAMASPKDVCQIIRNDDSFFSTQDNADSCDKLVSDGNFDNAALNVCKTIAQMDSYNSTQSNALACLKIIKNKYFDPSRVQSCQTTANEDTFESTQDKAISCLKNSAQISAATVAPRSQPETKQEPTSAKNIESIQGRNALFSLDIIQMPQDGKTYYVLILRNVIISNRNIGNILLYPMTGTLLEAQKFQEILSQTIQTQTYDSLPLQSVKVSYLTSPQYKLAELTEKNLPPESNITLRVGRIELVSGTQDLLDKKSSSLSYGMKE